MGREFQIDAGFHLKCPGCTSEMRRVELEHFCIDRCRACGGMWLDAAELQKVEKIKGAVAKVDAGRTPGAGRDDPASPWRGVRQGGRLCPRDGEKLKETTMNEQKHVVVDKCPTCLGMFLDAGELTDLADHTLVERVVGWFK